LRKLDPARRAALLEALKDGNYKCVAAQRAGIGASTLRRWLSMGRRSPQGALRQFYDEVVEAQTYAEILAVQAIIDHFQSDWRAALAYLERKFPKRWSNRRERTVETAQSRRAVPKVVRVAYEPRDLAQIARELFAAGAIDPSAPDAAADRRDPPQADDQAGGVSAP
jgi:hypothetical protein